MRGLGVYFTWPMFFVRLVLAIALMPVFLAAGFIVGARDYWRYRKHGYWYYPETFFGYVKESIKTFGRTVGWFILGGFKILKG